jgi:replicative DNA helicase
MSLATRMIDVFKGRRGVVAVATGPSSFEPEYVSITSERIERDHLSGERCLGFYLLRESDKCCCSCADFDNKLETPDPKWREKAEAFYYALLRLGLSPIMELSQSGEGAHVWLFFRGEVDAWLPRSFWRALSKHISTPIKEIYPRQDHATGKGLGNLVRYPLWSNSAFVDVENEWVLVDPDAALADVKLIDGADLAMVAFQSGLGELIPDPSVTLTQIDVGDASAVISTRVARLIGEESTLLGKRWQNDPIGMTDTSRSAVAMSLCCELVRAYVPTPEIASALRTWCRKHGAEEKGDRDDWVNRTVAKAYDYVLSRNEKKSVSATTFWDAAHAYVDGIERGDQFHLCSGIRELDASIDGIGPGEVAIIAARPNHGKTALALQWLGFASSLGVRGLMISEEMGRLELGKRRLLSVSSIPDSQWVQASAAALRKDIDTFHRGKADVYIVESCSTIDRVDEVIDQFCSLYNVGLVAIDYLQLLGARMKDRYEIVTECSRRIKKAAQRNGVAILLLSQLNRAVEGREDNEPKLSDLRESGGIEQDADLVLFAQWPCRFDSRMPEHVYRIFCAKRRNGPIRHGRVETEFNPNKQIIGMPPLPPEVQSL